MRFISIYTHVPTNRPPTEAEMTRMGNLVEQAMKEGWLIATEGVHFGQQGVRVHKSTAGKVTVTDGPFAEAKEQVVGYCIVDCESRDRAIEIAIRWPDARRWGMEVRPILSPDGVEM